MLSAERHDNTHADLSPQVFDVLQPTHHRVFTQREQGESKRTYPWPSGLKTTASREESAGQLAAFPPESTQRCGSEPSCRNGTATSEGRDGDLPPNVAKTTPSPARQAERGAPVPPRLMKAPVASRPRPQGGSADLICRSALFGTGQEKPQTLKSRSALLTSPAKASHSTLSGSEDQGMAHRGRRAQKPCPCPRLLNFYPCGVPGPAPGGIRHPPCSAEDVGKDQPKGARVG